MPDARPATDERPVGGLSAHLESAWLLGGVRYFLPAIVVLAGLVVMAFGSEADLEGGASILSAGLAVYFLNWLFRAGAAGDRERDAEDAARAYFDRHGRWPE
ncbi:MAG TPA: hypothetical protein VKG62_03435 [Solirubrobacteraceae bacterium]|nr:hypothetical protein [Solirubrobacteraceae bacterium]